ncbi:MAG: glycine cleavage system aminomethyltransferase GcvT [Thermoleophilia bacterium]|nr:glycine cleavage system aminomethyltransferase GcvT [Thermoleophilia bacterium]
MRRTPLHDTHRSAGARLVPFAGWEMPVQYDGVLAEHRAVRERVGVFDVSHMGQLHVEGPNAAALLQATLSNDLGRIADGEAQYTLLTDLSGGIIDDLIVYRLTPHHFLLVVNAGNRDEAYAWLKEREVRGSEVRDASDEYAMLAVQGPAALAALGLADGHTFTHAIGAIDGIEAMVCRTGYTGERGVELLCPAENAVELWEAVVARDATPCGLAARDTLRLEMCYPLHGSDITRETDPISAGLGWACVLEKEFTGVGALRRVREEGQERKLVAFVMEDKAVPRQGMAILEGGVVSSGTHSPSLDFGIGMAWVPAALAAIGTELTVDVRGRERRARVVRKPIYSREDR